MTDSGLQRNDVGNRPPLEGDRLAEDLRRRSKAARQAQRQLARCSAEQRDGLLRDIAQSLRSTGSQLAAANRSDLDTADAAGVSAALRDRLKLDAARLTALADSVDTVADLPDPLSVQNPARRLPSGLWLGQRPVPLGVVGVIYEARPNVTIDIAVAALKSGNAVLLRGGREARHSNLALVELLHRCLQAAGLPTALVDFIDDPSRESVGLMLQMTGLIDVLVPRGGQPLVDFCQQHSRVPLIVGGAGVVHIYVDATVDIDRALEVIDNAKTQRPAVCNAVDTLLLNREVAPQLLPRLARRLAGKGVGFRSDSGEAEVLHAAGANVVPLQDSDFDTEWLSLTLGVRVVDDLDAALAHIQAHGSGHSESILTDDPGNAERFLAEVDAAAVYVNASPRFTDGGAFGMGVEVAVSTMRQHPRGPVGPAQLTSLKWVGRGDYLCR